jgi:hypothetical protein
MSINDLAGSAVYAPSGLEQLYAGDKEITSDAAVALAGITKYQLVAVTATGVTPFVFATHTPAQAAVAAQTVAQGAQCPYFNGGYFNHAMIGWPAGTDLNTYEKRRAFGTGTLKFGHITPVY